MLNARPTTRTSLQCLILSACVAVGLSLEARGQELLEFVDNASMSGVASGSPLDRLPNILGDFFQSTGQQNATFRPEATAPATASGAGVGLGAGTSPVVLDAAAVVYPQGLTGSWVDRKESVCEVGHGSFSLGVVSGMTA